MCWGCRSGRGRRWPRTGEVDCDGLGRRCTELRGGWGAPWRRQPPGQATQRGGGGHDQGTQTSADEVPDNDMADLGLRSSLTRRKQGGSQGEDAMRTMGMIRGELAASYGCAPWSVSLS